MKKRMVIITLTAAVIIAGVGLGTYALLLSDNSAVQAINNNQLSVGEKYLAELNYEKATAALENVITVEPSNAQAYLALSKAYCYMGDIDSAIKTLESGYSVTNSTVIEVELQTLSNSSNSFSNDTVETAKIVELAGQSFLSDTTELILRDCGLTDADMVKLSEFTALERLDISGNNITDLSEVSKLTALKKFYAANNDISDVSALSGLQSLEYIGLRGNRITNADVLFELNNLKYLHLSNNLLSAVPTVKENLQLLYLSDNELTDITAVQNAKLLFCDVSKNAGI